MIRLDQTRIYQARRGDAKIPAVGLDDLGRAQGFEGKRFLGKQGDVARIQILPRTVIRAEQHGGGLEGQFLRQSRIVKFARLHLDADLGRVGDERGKRRHLPGIIRDELDGFPIGERDIQLRQQTGLLGHAMKIAHAEVARDDANLVRAVPEVRRCVNDIVLKMLRPTARRTVVDPLVVDEEPVKTVGGDAQRGLFRLGQPELFLSDDGLIVGMHIRALAPDPFGLQGRFGDCRRSRDGEPSEKDTQGQPVPARKNQG